MSSAARTVISVIGAGSEIDPATEAAAEAVGRGIAEAGAVLVCGGMGGVMAAACRGARAAGGLTVGLLPGVRHDMGNPDLVIPIPTGLGEGRNLPCALAGHAVIAVDGRLGTLSEIALALNNGRAVIGLGSWTVNAARSGGATVTPADSPAEAVRLALEAAGTD